jgi:hypothetical protein
MLGFVLGFFCGWVGRGFYCESDVGDACPLSKVFNRGFPDTEKRLFAWCGISNFWAMTAQDLPRHRVVRERTRGEGRNRNLLREPR